MKILGYSERGIINSLIFEIGGDKALMDGFVKEIGIEGLFKPEQPKDYEILLEQSFSGFGDADLIVIIEYESCKKVLFIEGKVKTSQRKHWSLHKQFNKYNEKKKYNGYSSNLFFQLYLKRLLMKKKDTIKNNRKSKIIGRFRERKIGENEIVWKAFKKLLKIEKAYYVGLIPSTNKEIYDFEKVNNTGLHFLAWETIHKFCKDNEKLEKVVKIFDYNDGQIY